MFFVELSRVEFENYRCTMESANADFQLFINQTHEVCMTFRMQYYALFCFCFFNITIQMFYFITKFGPNTDFVKNKLLM